MQRTLEPSWWADDEIGVEIGLLKCLPQTVLPLMRQERNLVSNFGLLRAFIHAIRNT